MNSISHRPAFVEAHPELKQAHRAAQCALFGAAHRAGLSNDQTEMLEGINEALNRKGARRLTSRRQLKIEEMNEITRAIEAGLFSSDWTWGHDFMLYIQTATIEIPAQRVRVSSTHHEPLNSERARQWNRPVRPTMTANSRW